MVEAVTGLEAAVGWAWVLWVGMPGMEARARELLEAREAAG